VARRGALEGGAFFRGCATPTGSIFCCLAMLHVVLSPLEGHGGLTVNKGGGVNGEGEKEEKG